MKQYMKAYASPGSTLNLDVDTGANEEKVEQGLGYSVIMRMTEHYLNPLCTKCADLHQKVANVCQTNFCGSRMGNP